MFDPERFKWWIILSSEWKLQDVQAGLVVIISILSFIAVFATARFFWHLSARRISKKSDVPISSLLSFTTLGEVFDVIVLLKGKVFTGKHFTIATQCLFVIAFSACAILAGPISRYATRVGQMDGLKPVPGLLATRSFFCDAANTIRWHNVSQSLDQAKFPYNQLLDFLPDTASNWAYHAEDWNSTYSAKCSFTTESNITLEAIGNWTSNEYYIYDNVPGLSDVYSARFLSDPNNTQYMWSYGGTRNPGARVWKDMFFQQYAELRPDHDGKKSASVPTQRISIHLSIIAMHDVPMYTTSDLFKFDYAISKGKIPKAWYTKVECDITRNQPIDKYNYYEAFVDQTKCDIADNMNQYFSSQGRIPHSDNSTSITLPTGEELFRFYQAYNIAKDTHFPNPVTRKINLRLPTVEISTFFIGVMSLFILLVLVLLVHAAICRFAYAELYKRVPETKVDWLLQSLREAQGGNTAQAKSHTPSSNGDYEEYIAAAQKEKMPWEKAYYSLANPHHSPTPSEAGLGRVSVYHASRSPSPAPPSLIPGPPAPAPFTSFVSNINNANNGYTPLPNTTPTPYMAPYPARSASPAFTSPPLSPDVNVNNNPTSSNNNNNNNDRIVSYGMTGVKMQPLVHVAPRNEKAEWQVGVVENRR